MDDARRWPILDQPCARYRLARATTSSNQGVVGHDLPHVAQTVTRDRIPGQGSARLACPFGDRAVGVAQEYVVESVAVEISNLGNAPARGQCIGRCCVVAEEGSV